MIRVVQGVAVSLEFSLTPASRDNLFKIEIEYLVFEHRKNFLQSKKTQRSPRASPRQDNESLALWISKWILG